MRSFGNRKRTRADKLAAAVQFVTLSLKPDAEKVQSLVASYGFSPAEAEKFVKERGGRAA